MKTKILLVAATLLFPLHSLADQNLIFRWGILSPQEASSWITVGADTTRMTAFIAYSSSGNKKLYFNFSGYDKAKDETLDMDFCNPVGFNDNGVIHLNNQAIAVSRWCKKFRDSSIHYLELTARSPQGEAYIVNQLTRATEAIEIEVDGVKYTLSAEGFTKAWNKTSDKAL